MKNIGLLAAIAAGVFSPSAVRATDFNDIQFWTGSGTNRAALVIHWSAPEVRNSTSVPNPVAEKSLVWGFRWNGTNNAEQMFNAVVAADHRLFVASSDPFPGFGPFIYAIGYDLNNNGVFGIRFGTNVLAENAFTNGQYIIGSEDTDSAQSLDAGDLLWSGLFGANWETWREHGGMGGFTNAPDRGPAPYWTPTDTDFFSAGFHGQWDYTSGLETITLQDGSWVGFTVSGGGLNFADENDPGTIAYDYHKHAPAAPEVASTNSPFAVEVVANQGPFGASPYNDPNCVLGAPATRFFESGSKPATRVKLIEPALNYSVVNGVTNKLIVTLNNGSSIVARLDHPIQHNPANPYGIDFQVFGNAFYVGNGFSGDAANMNSYMLTSGGFYEPTKISVSPGYTGATGEDPNDPSTWAWYRFDNGPYGDTDCPTQAYRWNRGGTNWTDELLDFTKPVNPALKSLLNASGGALSVADAIDLYCGSGGGTGFNISESGFASIQYVKAEGISPGFSGGEIDAFSITRPMTVGDTLAIAPGNLTNGAAQLLFQVPGNESQTAVSLNFAAIGDIAQVATGALNDSAALAAAPGTILSAAQLALAPMLGSNAVSFQADLGLFAGSAYSGDGHDLHAFQWNGTNWLARNFVFDAVSRVVTVQSVTNLSAFAVVQVGAPTLAMQLAPGGPQFQFIPVANWTHTLERSTDFVNWTAVTSVTPTTTDAVQLQDDQPPLDHAFYRLRLSHP